MKLWDFLYSEVCDCYSFFRNIPFPKLHKIPNDQRCKSHYIKYFYEIIFFGIILVRITLFLWNNINMESIFPWGIIYRLNVNLAMGLQFIAKFVNVMVFRNIPLPKLHKNT